MKLTITITLHLHCSCKNIPLNENLYCISCNKRVAGDLREELLEHYAKFKFCRSEVEEGAIYHVTPSHACRIRYYVGCEICDEMIPEELGILTSIYKNYIPEIYEELKEFKKILKIPPYHATVFPYTIEVASETL